MHSWVLHVESDDGIAIEGAIINVEGGMPKHNHGIAANVHGAYKGNRLKPTNQIETAYTHYTMDTGGNQPHNNMQPYLILNYIIKVE